MGKDLYFTEIITINVLNPNAHGGSAVIAWSHVKFNCAHLTLDRLGRHYYFKGTVM